LEKAVKAAPESADLKGELARAYITAGQTDDAIELLNTILGKGGEQQQTQALLISAYLRAGEYDRAIDTVMSMLAKQPDDPAALTLAGSVFASSGDNAEARNYYRKACRLGHKGSCNKP
jgi:FimV-like protein